MSTRTSGQETENNLTGTTRNEWGVSEHIVKTIGGDDAYTSGGLRSYRSELADRSTTLSDVADSNESVPVIQRDKMNDIVRWRAASEGLHRIAIGAMTQRGIPTIRGTRITVAQVLDSLSEHVRVEDVVEDLNGMITCDDVRDILIFAARLAR